MIGVIAGSTYSNTTASAAFAISAILILPLIVVERMYVMM